MLIVMNPFDTPPTTPRVSTDPPVDTPAPRRGRMALVALASAGLVAGGIVGVSAVGSADDPQLETSDVAAAAAGDDTTTDDDGDGDTGDAGDRGGPSVDGEIVIDLGDGEPIVIDVGDVGDLDGEQFAELGDCLGLPFLDLGPMGDLPFEFPEGEFEAWIEDLPDVFGEFQLPDEFDVGEFAMVPDGEVSVFGPDGVTVIDLGEGDGSVTISRDGETGELTITTDGTASEQTLDDLFGEFEFGELPEFPGEFEFGELSPDEIEEVLGELPEFPMFDDFDPERVHDCLAELD